MTVELFAHQAAGARWLAEQKKAQLGDTPGLGKTYTAIRALELLGARTPLIVCPAIAKTHWERSLRDAGVDFGPAAEVASFERVVNDGVAGMAYRIHGANPIDAIVVDESQYCKTESSQRAKLILGNNGYGRRLKIVLALSGSIPKHPGELFNIVCSLRPDLLVKYDLTTREAWMEMFTIRRRRMVRGVSVEKVVGQTNVVLLREILSQVILRRELKDTGLDVPSLWFQTVAIDGAPPDEATTLTAHGVDVSALGPFIDVSTLQDIADDPEIARMRRRVGELKAPLVVEMLKEQLRGTDEKIVVFAHHRAVLDVLRQGLDEFGVAYVDGDTSQKDRDEAIDDFQSNFGRRIFLGQNIACRFSVTLTAATRAVLVEPSWSADDNVQMGRRIARIGSVAQKCVAQMICLAGTLDEAIVKQHAREAQMAEEVFA